MPQTKNSENYAIALRRSNTPYGEKLYPEPFNIEKYKTDIQARPAGNNSIEWQNSHTIISPLSGIPMNKRGSNFNRNKEKLTNGVYLHDINKNFKHAIQNGDHVILYIEPEVGSCSSQDEPLKLKGKNSIFNFVTTHKRNYAVIPVKSIKDISKNVDHIRQMLIQKPTQINEQLHVCFMGAVARITDLNIPHNHNDKLIEIIKRLKSNNDNAPTAPKIEQPSEGPSNEDDEDRYDPYTDLGYTSPTK